LRFFRGNFAACFAAWVDVTLGKSKTKERGIPMNNKLAQLAYFISKIDQRHIQLAYFVFMLVGFVICSPSDGGTGPYKA